MVGVVEQPVATIYADAAGLAFPLPSDSVDLAVDESQAGPTNPGDGTQGPPLSEAQAALMAAQADAKRDISRTKWALIGGATWFGGLVPMLAVHLAHPGPPATRLLGKTPEYTAFYVETWKNRSHARRVKYAWIGAGIFVAAFLGVTAVACRIRPCSFGPQ